MLTKVSFLSLAFLFSLNASAETVELLCKNFSFGMTVGGVVPSRSAATTYEKISIRDAANALKTVMVPTRMILSQQFAAVTTAAGARGERLADGQCGLADRAIAGINTDPRRGIPQIKFDSFPSTFTQIGASLSGLGIGLAVNLPLCASGIRRFRAIMENPNSFFLTNSTGNVSCVE